MFYYGFDLTYLILVLPFVIMSLWASSNVNSTFRRYSQVYSKRGMTGAQAADQVLKSNGIYNVRIEQVSGNLTDHYDPKSNVIRLSTDVYGSTSVASIGVACHEAGHAVQYAQNYGPIKLRAAIIPVTNIGSMLAIPLIIFGLVLNFMAELSFVFVYIGIGCFGLSLLLQLITLPVEFNASRRAVSAIKDSSILYEDELDGAKKTLRAAALTYVAAAAVSLMQFLRLLMLFGGRRRND